MSGGAEASFWDIRIWMGSTEMEATPVDSFWGTREQRRRENLGEVFEGIRVEGFNRMRGLNLILEWDEDPGRGLKM